MLISEEGKKLMPYRCSAGKLTVGIGHNLDDCGISESTCEQMLAEDVTKCLLQLHRIFGVEKFNSFSANRRLALLNFIFNVGMGTFLQFKTMIGCINSGDWERAASGLLQSLYAKQVPKRADRIARMLREDAFPY